jgi:hypothetical protein
MKSFSTLPQELYRSRPRELRLSGAGRAIGVVAIALCLAAPALGIFLRRQAMTDRFDRHALLQSGVVAEGVVVRLKRDSKENKRATVYYQFTANGRAFEDHARVPMARWRTLNVGRAFPVRYVAANPAVNIPDGVEPGVMPSALPYILSPLPLLIGLVCLLTLQLQRGLLSNGRAAMAVVKSVTKRRGQHGESIKTVRYEFPLLSGVTQAGSLQTHSAAPEVGSAIAVLYDAEHPRRSRPYPLSLVRLAEGD